MLITRVLTKAINDNINGAKLLSPFADKTISIEFKPIRLKSVWRIDASGKVEVVAPQIRGDVKVRIVSLPNNIKIEGDAALLKSFSTLINQMDWTVIISDAFGPILAPRVLLLIEKLRESINTYCDKHFLDPKTFDAYSKRVQNISNQINILDNRINSIVTGNNHDKKNL